MSRAAVFRALADDPELNGMGVREDTIFPNYAMDQSPTRKGMFVILRWTAQDFAGGSSIRSARSFRGTAVTKGRGARNFEVWVHCPKELANDFGDIDVVLDRIEDVLLGMEHVKGADGQTVTCIQSTGRSPDTLDQGFDTVSRNASFEILSRPTA